MNTQQECFMRRIFPELPLAELQIRWAIFLDMVRIARIKRTVKQLKK